jgi:fatty acid synthase subunit alpha
VKGVRKLEMNIETVTDRPPHTVVNTDKVQEGVLEPWNVVKSRPEIGQEQKNCVKALYDGVVRSFQPDNGNSSRYTSCAPPNSCACKWSFQ